MFIYTKIYDEFPNNGSRTTLEAHKYILANVSKHRISIQSLLFENNIKNKLIKRLLYVENEHYDKVEKLYAMNHLIYYFWMYTKWRKIFYRFLLFSFKYKGGCSVKYMHHFNRKHK